MAKEIHETSNLKKNLEFPFYTKQVEFETGEYKMGDLVELSGKKVKKLTAPANIYGVVTDDFTSDGSKNKKHTVYWTGAFNEKFVNFNEQDKDATKEAARKLLIMID
ncbi:Phage protein [Fusobacterium necrophorum subsp. funduliforme]|uniref:hypothetical protein n=1 Tax=Fusobacterium necrophorum TaxID=859 RepID=UPI00254C949E|nr:hypothetical protein [Fusobacterium necrophorum]MDK4496686.1 hypothetical protein [Fusobacterium necrophorum]